MTHSRFNWGRSQAAEGDLLLAAGNDQWAESKEGQQVRMVSDNQGEVWPRVIIMSTQTQAYYFFLQRGKKKDYNSSYSMIMS